MTTGQYAAISTMAAMQAAHTALSNNLANVGTPGYKQDIPQAEQFNDIFVTLLDVNLGLGNVDTTTEIEIDRGDTIDSALDGVLQTRAGVGARIQRVRASVRSSRAYRTSILPPASPSWRWPRPRTAHRSGRKPVSCSPVCWTFCAKAG